MAETSANPILEQSVRLSQSMLWDTQRAFYASGRSIQAWQEGIVPQFITSNPFIAASYARVISAFIDDCHSATGEPIDPNQPIQIIELGSGTGRFGFHLLQQLTRLRRHSRRPTPFRLVMTDLVDRHIALWREHLALQPFVDRGLLDFARFDVERDTQLDLLISGETLSAETVRNPVVLVANYVFDSITQDAFVIDDGRLFEVRVTVTSRQPEPDRHDPEMLTRIALSYEFREASADCYDDPIVNRILLGYQQRHRSATVLVPVGALRACRFFRELSHGRLLLLSADTGTIDEQALVEADLPTLVVHGGAFSLDVNYHAIAEYFRIQGGDALYSLHRPENLQMLACLLGTPEGHPETRRAFGEAIEQFNPDDYFTLIAGLVVHVEGMSLAEIVAILRLSGHDPSILNQVIPVLLQRVENAPEKSKHELYRVICSAWETYFHLGEKPDLPFRLGLLLYRMGYLPEALAFFDHSHRLYGADPGTSFNRAVCYYELQQMDKAQECAWETLRLEPTHEQARAMLAEVAGM